MTEEVGFRVVRKIGDDALLVSWTAPGNQTENSENKEKSSSNAGYEVLHDPSTHIRTLVLIYLFGYIGR